MGQVKKWKCRALCNDENPKYSDMTIVVIDSLPLWIEISTVTQVTLYTTGHLHTAVPYCSHSRAPIVHTAMPRENNEHGCVYLRCRAVCKLPGCVEGHPCVTGMHQQQAWFT